MILSFSACGRKHVIYASTIEVGSETETSLELGFDFVIL
jgi:hypothetical protein